MIMFLGVDFWSFVVVAFVWVFHSLISVANFGSYNILRFGFPGLEFF